MFKSEEHKLDKLEKELLNIEKFAKNHHKNTISVLKIRF